MPHVEQPLPQLRRHCRQRYQQVQAPAEELCRRRTQAYADAHLQGLHLLLEYLDWLQDRVHAQRHTRCSSQCFTESGKCAAAAEAVAIEIEPLE